MKTLFMETTKIEPAQTVGEIQRILGLYGASYDRFEKADFKPLLEYKKEMRI